MNSSGNGGSIAASSYVLDASAVLALVLEEPGRDMVAAAARRGAIIGSFNLAEVVTRLIGLGFTDEEIRRFVELLRLRIEPLDATIGWTAGYLYRHTRPFGLSLGDRACLALAQRLALPVLTADRQWAQLDIGVEVVLCR